MSQERRISGEALEASQWFAAEIDAWPVTDDQLDDLLWNATAYPFAPPGHVADQLAELRRLSGGNYAGAMAIASLDDRVFELTALRPPLPAGSAATDPAPKCAVEQSQPTTDHD